MLFQLNPLAPNGLSIKPEVQPTRTTGGVVAGIPAGGAANQILQKAASPGAFWGVSLTVSTTAPSNPGLNDLWIDIS